jgi:hypothetical protein
VEYIFSWNHPIELYLHQFQKAINRFAYRKCAISASNEDTSWYNWFSNSSHWDVFILLVLFSCYWVCELLIWLDPFIFDCSLCSFRILLSFRVEKKFFPTLLSGYIWVYNYALSRLFRQCFIWIELVSDFIKYYVWFRHIIIWNLLRLTANISSLYQNQLSFMASFLLIWFASFAVGIISFSSMARFF